MTSESNKVSRKKARQEKLNQEKRKRNTMLIFPIVILIAAIGMFAFLRLRSVEGVTDFGAQDRGHDIEAEFASNSLPPVGGTHDPSWQNCGIYSEPIDTGPAVHSMEHGAVWIAYHPDLPTEDVSVLEELVRGNTYMLLSPFPNLEGEVVATAWGVQLESDSVSDGLLEQFVDRYRGGGPEPGAPCDGGLGRPVQ